jgi:hypothetical protein
LLYFNEPQAMLRVCALRRAILGMAVLTTVALAIVFAVSPVPSQAKTAAGLEAGGRLTGKF